MNTLGRPLPDLRVSVTDRGNRRGGMPREIFGADRYSEARSGDAARLPRVEMSWIGDEPHTGATT